MVGAQRDEPFEVADRRGHREADRLETIVVARAERGDGLALLLRGRREVSEGLDRRAQILPRALLRANQRGERLTHLITDAGGEPDGVSHRDDERKHSFKELMILTHRARVTLEPFGERLEHLVPLGPALEQLVELGSDRGELGARVLVIRGELVHLRLDGGEAGVQVGSDRSDRERGPGDLFEPRAGRRALLVQAQQRAPDGIVVRDQAAHVGAERGEGGLDRRAERTQRRARVSQLVDAAGGPVATFLQAVERLEDRSQLAADIGLALPELGHCGAERRELLERGARVGQLVDAAGGSVATFLQAVERLEDRSQLAADIGLALPELGHCGAERRELLERGAAARRAIGQRLLGSGQP